MTDRRISVHDGGVVGITIGQVRLYAQMGEADGRWFVENLVIRGGGPGRISADVLRSLPVSWLESVVNAQYADDVRASVDKAAGLVEASPIGRALIELQITEARTRRPRRRQREPLTRPDGSDPDAFYGRVADAYRDAVGETPKVAKVLADEAGVPVATVHRWILEARRRGYLPPARQGRAG